ncbi:bli-5 [Pristionchus pacificus]|uniref:Bli-5 n=1 Tax=Pristionchus pacificus TaxID=54126 RepID=A0A2A6CHT5_PRIPA|nr:bli-5 [Pristionchus pacificus]|eukprot:PDM77650.1 bli-5 [Pristionchus pacificus]
MRGLPFLLLLLLLPLLLVSAQADDAACEECRVHWPGSACIRGRCRCPPDTLRVSSSSMQWVCLAIKDIITGEIGPPLTCPFPEGAGYKVVYRNSSSSSPVFCDSKQSPQGCPRGYECIRSLGFIGSSDGICCPDRDTQCEQPILDHSEDADSLPRFGYDGASCVSFRWNPNRPSTNSNNFRTREQCEHYCINYFKYKPHLLTYR